MLVADAATALVAASAADDAAASWVVGTATAGAAVATAVSALEASFSVVDMVSWDRRVLKYPLAGSVRLVPGAMELEYSSVKWD